MATPIPFNRRGIYGIRSLGAPVVTATDVTLQFEDHPYVNANYNGILIVDITAIPATSTLPVFFQTGNNAKVSATKGNGVPLTAEDIQETGYYLFFFSRLTGTLQLIN